jgi:hypothetical protein
MLNLNIKARTIGFPNSTEKTKTFICTMPKGSCIAKLDNEVKNKLKGELDHQGDSFVVGYMALPHSGNPYAVERDGKQCISDLFHQFPYNKLNVMAIVSTAAPGQGGSNKLFAAKGSRRATTAGTNIHMAMSNEQ